MYGFFKRGTGKTLQLSNCRKNSKKLFSKKKRKGSGKNVDVAVMEHAIIPRIHALRRYAFFYDGRKICWNCGVFIATILPQTK